MFGVLFGVRLLVRKEKEPLNIHHE